MSQRKRTPRRFQFSAGTHAPGVARKTSGISGCNMPPVPTSGVWIFFGSEAVTMPATIAATTPAST